MNRILNFHEVYDYKWFDKLVGYLKSRYNMVSMDDINQYYQGDKKLRNSCHITVDDGEKSFHEVIFPVLRKHNIPATLYVSPKILGSRSNYWFQEMVGYDPVILRKVIAEISGVIPETIDKFDPVWVLKTLKIEVILEILKRYQIVSGTPRKAPQNITIDALKYFDKSGLVTIGAHTMNHPILYNEDNLSCDFEITESVKGLSDILNKPVIYFAYPNGKYDLDYAEREEGILLNCGVQLAVTTEPGNLSVYNNRMGVPRFGFPDSQRLELVRSKLTLAPYWNSFRKIVSTQEIKQRRALLSALA